MSEAALIDAMVRARTLEDARATLAAVLDYTADHEPSDRFREAGRGFARLVTAYDLGADLRQDEKRYDPDQPRDDYGRWVRVGGDLVGRTLDLGDAIEATVDDYVAVVDDPDDRAAARKWLRDRIDVVYAPAYGRLRANLKPLSDLAYIEPRIDRDKLDAIADPDRTPVAEFRVGLARGERPDMTVWVNPDGTVDVDDILDVGDRDFFDGPDDEADYFRILDAVRGQPATPPPRLWRGMSPAEYADWEAGAIIPAGKFFTAERTAAYAQDIPGVFPDLYSFRIDPGVAVETSPGTWQLLVPAVLNGNRIEAVPSGVLAAAKAWDESRVVRDRLGRFAERPGGDVPGLGVGTDAFRRGECYSWAFRYLLEHEDARLVHGYVRHPDLLPNARFGHAWVETADGRALDWQGQEAGHYGPMSVALFRERLHAEPVRTYTFKEALEAAVEAEHYGPWDQSIHSIVMDPLPEEVRRQLGEKRFDPNQPRDRHGRWTDGPDALPASVAQEEARNLEPYKASLPDRPEWERSRALPRRKGRAPGASPVSRHVHVSPDFRSGKGKRAERALAAIDKAHYIGEPRHPVMVAPIRSDHYRDAATESTGAHLGGGYESRWDDAAEDVVPVRIGVVEDHPVGAFEYTLIHEVGHYIDQQVLGERGRKVGPNRIGGRLAASEWAARSLGGPPVSDADRADPGRRGMLRVMYAIGMSHAMRALAFAKENGEMPVWDENDDPAVDPPRRFSVLDPEDQGFIDYSLDPVEAFARAYAQYITDRSRVRRLETQDVALNNHMLLIPSGWRGTDFQPIALAFDQLFEDLGWRPKAGEEE